MSHATNDVGPGTTDTFDQLETSTAWELCYTTAHVGSLQTLAPSFTTEVTPPALIRIRYDPIILFIAEEPQRS